MAENQTDLDLAVFPPTEIDLIEYNFFEYFSKNRQKRYWSVIIN